MPDLPHGALKLAAEAIQPTVGTAGPSEAAVECARAALGAALEVIQRDAVKQAARHVLLLHGLAFGRICPACHGKPEPCAAGGWRDPNRCRDCGHEWKPPKHPDYGLECRSVLKRVARSGVLPDLPAKEAEHG